MTEVALMVLNWNGADLLRRHLPAVIEAADRARAKTRVYVIDNASTDESLSYIATLADVELLALSENRRLIAYNEAVHDVECETFMMLNNDVSPASDVVDVMLETLRSAPDTFAVGGDVVEIGSGWLESGPSSARWDGRFELEPVGARAAGGATKVAYVSGGAGLYRRDMFLEMGGFWEALPGLYWEDVELGLRAWLHGWSSLYCPEARFDHASGATVKRALNPRVREFRTHQNIRLAHLALLLDPADRRAYERRELRRPGQLAVALSLLPLQGEVRRRRQALRKRCGALSARELEARWRQ
jgi:GT2 family glycosyltransferase